MNILQALILSVVEGISEFLPISSTGHLILAAKIMNITQSEFVKSFEIIIQLGAIGAVCFHSLPQVRSQKTLIPKVGIAFLPTVTIGFMVYKLVKHYLIGNTLVVVISLAVGGIILILIEKFLQRKQLTMHDLTNNKAFIIGLFQTLAIIPGVSRSAATIVGAMLCGLSPKEAISFSFLLAIPTMLAATSLDVIKTGLAFSSAELQILALGLIGSFFTALITLRWLMRYVQHHSFVPFGAYRIAAAILFALFFIK